MVGWTDGRRLALHVPLGEGIKLENDLLFTNYVLIPFDALQVKYIIGCNCNPLGVHLTVITSIQNICLAKNVWFFMIHTKTIKLSETFRGNLQLFRSSYLSL